MINPSTCFGQLLQPGLNASCAVLQDTQEYHWLGDVAMAQLLLFETPNASGRYLCTNGIYQFRDFADKISKFYSEFPIHRFTGETQPGLLSFKEAAKRLIELGLSFFEGETQPGLVSCKDAAKRLIELGLSFIPVEDAISVALKQKASFDSKKPLSLVPAWRSCNFQLSTSLPPKVAAEGSQLLSFCVSRPLTAKSWRPKHPKN